MEAKKLLPKAIRTLIIGVIAVLFLVTPFVDDIGFIQSASGGL